MSKRRLIGPTIVTLVLCGLWTDYVFFADSPWSVVRFLSKVIMILRAIFGPLFNPELYGWVNDIAFPALLIVLAIALLSLSILRAKTAMTDATPDADEPLLRAELQPAPGPKPAVTHQTAPVASSQKRPLGGLFGGFILAFTTVSVLLSVAVCLVAYRYIYGITDQNLENRADAMALGLADISAQHFAAGTLVDLAAKISRYAPDRTVAYAYVEDAQGKIVGHMPPDLPRYLSRDFPRSSEQAIRGVEVEYRGAPGYEIAKRIGGGTGGFVHLGIWRAALDEETRLVMTPMVATIFALVLAAGGVFVFVIRSVNRLFSQLVDHAERVSKGELGIALELKNADEIGEIARSLERLRSSLQAAVIRLDQDQ